MDWSTIKGMSIAEGEVVKIEDADGNVIWQKSGGVSRITFVQDEALANAEYEITTGGEVIESGTGWSATMTFELPRDEYTLSLTAFGTTATYDFAVTGDQTIDISDMFATLLVRNLVQNSTVSLNGIEAGTTTGTGVSRTVSVYVLRSTTPYAVSATCSMKYSGASSSPLLSYTTAEVTVNTGDTEHDMIRIGTIVTITNSGTLSVPISGSYEMLAIGGGGAGGGVINDYYGTGGGGGGSGRITSGTKSLSATSYTVTIGAGGTAQNYATGGSGGATSFSNILTASGGSGGGGGSSTTLGTGGSGGAGGGAGAGANKKGGVGSYGGGGGGRVSASSGGTYGGAGGYYNSSSDYGTAKSGTSTQPNTIYYGASYAGGSNGSHSGSPLNEYQRGRGGGGGRGAKGGNGGNGRSDSGYVQAYGGHGGGGGGGLSSTKIAGDGVYYYLAGAGAKGAVRLQFIG